MGENDNKSTKGAPKSDHDLPDSSAAPAHSSGFGALSYLAATGRFTPDEVATVIRRFPGELNAILGVLYRGAGTQFVLQVMTALREPAEPSAAARSETNGGPVTALETAAASIRRLMEQADAGWDRKVVAAFEQSEPAARIALQRKLDMEKLIAAMSDFEASRLGTLGPVIAGQDRLNRKRAAYIKQAIDDYPPQRAEVFALFVLRGAYDDDAYAIFAELANQRRLSRLMAMPEVAAHVHARGLDPSRFAEPDESWTAGVGGFGRGIKHFLKDDRPGRYRSQKAGLPDEENAALWQLEMAEFQDNLRPGHQAITGLDELTFGVPRGMVNLARDTVGAIGDIAEGEYERAGERLTGAGIVLLTHLGVKAWTHLRNRRDARRPGGDQAAPDETSTGLKGPEGPGQFHILNFEGPITLQEARLGAIFALNPEAQAAMGRLLSRIGRDGIEKAAALVQADSRAALFVAEHGELGVYALLDAEGNVTAAATRLPSRQLAATSSQREMQPAKGQGSGDHATTPLANTTLRSVHAPLTSAEVDASVTRIKASPQVSGDMNVLDGIARRAKLGEEGALGELEALNRWISEGRSIEVLSEVQNELLPSGKARTNPDYRVDGTVTEIKTRSKKFPEPGQGGKRSRDWIKHEISEANKQVRNSTLMEQGQVELQLRGEAEMSLSEIERHVRGNFTSEYGKSLKRVAVYQDSTLVGEWLRDRDGRITRTFPTDGESK